MKQRVGGDRAESRRVPTDPDGMERCAEPLVRVLSIVAPNATPFVAATSSFPSPSTATLDRIASQLVRKVGLGANSVHLEFGQGVWAEGKLLVSSTDHGVEIILQAPSGVNTSELQQALTLRLERRGIKVSSLEVT